ncbi:c-type cytochrome [Nitratifractor sp.]
MRNKSLTLLLAGTLALSLAGCGKKQEESAENSAAAPQIKITQGAVKKVKDKAANEENSGKFYYSYNTEKNASKEEPKTRTTLDAYLHIRSPYERVQITLMIKRLSRDFIVRCSPCHDDYANGVIGPSLLGKNGDFIYQHLIDFKTGKRKNVLMKELVSQIDDAKLKSIADEIAAFNEQIQKLRKGRQ